MIKSIHFIVLFFVVILIECNSYARTITFSNLIWEVKDGFGGAGRNYWSNENAFVDENGWLHLKITHVKGKWYCSEIHTTTPLGFGQYWFYIIGQIDNLEPNVVFGLFNYPSKGNAPDKTNEIDIEFSKWGVPGPTASNISYTVWPSILEPNKTVLSYTMKLSGDYSTHGFTWDKDKIFYQSGYGHYKDYSNPILTWLFAPPDFENRIPQKELPTHINLWLNNGKPPVDGHEVEIIIKKFCYKPLKAGQSNCDKSNI